MMPDPSRSMSVLRSVLLVVLAAGAVSCASGAAEKSPSASAGKAATSTAGKGESELLMTAELALRDGDCRTATEHFLAASKLSGEIALAMRASQLALGCDQLGAARAATARWRELDIYSGDAALAAALVALKRYDLAEARNALTAWRESGVAGSQDPLRFAEMLEQEADVTALYRVFDEVLVGDDPTAEVLLAQARLSMSAQNMNAAMNAAQGALERDANLIEAQTIVLRALSVLGEHAAAVAGVRALDASQLRGEDAFLLADLLAAAERTDDAQAELRRLGALPETRLGAARRQISMAIRVGDLEGAEKLLGPLLGDRDSTVMAVLYMAQLAELRGDDERAMQSYRLLADSSLGLQARAAAARIMIRNGEAEGALAVLDAYAGQNPDDAIEVGATRALLQAQSGDVDGALKTLDLLSEQFPEHPDLEYQRATVLETGGRTRAAVAQFERALKLRPDDPQLQNALGFTLADHKQNLARAEQLVRAALAASPDSPAIQDSLGWVLYRRGKTAAALPILARAWKNSGDGEIGSHFGEVLWKSGDEGQARYVWQQALNSNPAHPHLLATMKRLTGEDVAAE
jgi:predicted Zn-dependent protease